MSNKTIRFTRSGRYEQIIGVNLLPIEHKRTRGGICLVEEMCKLTRYYRRQLLLPARKIVTHIYWGPSLAFQFHTYENKTYLVYNRPSKKGIGQFAAREQ